MPLPQREYTDPPGTGVPTWENFLLNQELRIQAALRSEEACLKGFENEVQLILQSLDSLFESEFLKPPKNLPRLWGIEDASRRWNLLQVVDHLTQSNRQVLGGIESLTVPELRAGGAEQSAEAMAGNPSRLALDVDCLPNSFSRLEDVQQVISEYIASSEEYANRIRDLGPLRTESQRVHRWLGALDAHQWHAWSWLHTKTHRRQIEKILSMFGRV